MCVHSVHRAMLKLPPSTLLLPPAKADDVSNLLDVFRRLDESDMPCKIHPLKVAAQGESGHVYLSYSGWRRHPKTLLTISTSIIVMYS